MLMKIGLQINPSPSVMDQGIEQLKGLGTFKIFAGVEGKFIFQIQYFMNLDPSKRNAIHSVSYLRNYLFCGSSL